MTGKDLYSNLRERLENTSSWPSVYMFKFILPNDNRKMAMMRQIFEEDSRFFEKSSSKGNYISVTVKTVMINPDDVIACYRRVSEIEGIIML